VGIPVAPCESVIRCASPDENGPAIVSTQQVE
jgi:hypothetical protein